MARARVFGVYTASTRSGCAWMQPGGTRTVEFLTFPPDTFIHGLIQSSRLQSIPAGNVLPSVIHSRALSEGMPLC